MPQRALTCEAHPHLETKTITITIIINITIIILVVITPGVQAASYQQDGHAFTVLCPSVL